MQQYIKVIKWEEPRVHKYEAYTHIYSYLHLCKCVAGNMRGDTYIYAPLVPPTLTSTYFIYETFFILKVFKTKIYYIKFLLSLFF